MAYQKERIIIIVSNIKAGIGLGFLLFLIILITEGCAVTKPIKSFDNLLYEEQYKNIAYKSPTKKDYENKDEC